MRMHVEAALLIDKHVYISTLCVYMWVRMCVGPG